MVNNPHPHGLIGMKRQGAMRLKAIMKKCTAILLASILGLTGLAAAAAAETPVRVVLNGEVLSFEVDPILIDGRTYVEFRTLFTRLGYKVDYDHATRTVKATSPQRQIEMTPGKDTVLINGNPVDGKDLIRLVNGRTMVGLRFVITLSGKEVDWDGPTRTATVRDRWSPEEEKAVLELLDKRLLLEAENDGEGLTALYTSDSPLLVDWDPSYWERAHTVTTFEEVVIESITDTEAVVRVKDKTVKVGGAFFIENRAEVLYTLRKENGQWKIHNEEVLNLIPLGDPHKLFDQAVDVPEDVRAGLLEMTETLIRAIGDKNLDAVLAAMAFGSEEQKQRTAASFRSMLDQTNDSELEKWAVVDYDGSERATILAALVFETDAGIARFKTRTIIVADAKFIDGKWFMQPDYGIVHTEPIP